MIWPPLFRYLAGFSLGMSYANGGSFGHAWILVIIAVVCFEVREVLLREHAGQ
jgi:hypothetical protein